MNRFIPGNNTTLIAVCATLLALSATARSDDQDVSVSTSTATSQSPSDSKSSATPAPMDQQNIVIQTIEEDGKNKKQSRIVAWLGLAVEESSEALSSQLGLKHGEGLTVHYLAAGSPAAKADFQKNDVLVDLDGQMLVHPMQLRKLVQMHQEGDTVKVTFYRAGKKQVVSVKLGKTGWEEADIKSDTQANLDMEDLQSQLSGLNGQLRGMSESLSRARLEKQTLDRDQERMMEQTRRAIQDAVRRTTVNRRIKDESDVDLESVAHDGVNVDKDATVIVRNKSNSNRMVLQTDDTGTYIIERGAKTRLTARDQHGKLLFEGEIDTAAQREKVPKEVWEKVESMYDQVATPDESRPKAKDGKSGE
jgi:hypothetical protein